MNRILPLLALALGTAIVSASPLHGDEPARKPAEQKKKSDQPQRTVAA